MKPEVTKHIEKTEREEIFAGLLEYNLARIEEKDPQDLGVTLRGEDGVLLAGLIGETHGLWLTVKYLWVSERCRRRGYGSILLQTAEETARERGCRYAFLDTFDFQAPLFYQKHGYREAFTLENYPVSGKRHYYTKIL